MDVFNLGSLVGAGLLFLLQQIVSFLLKDWLERHKDQLRRALNFKLFMVALDLFVIGGLIWMAFELFNNHQPAARQDLLLGLGMQTMLIIVAMNLFDDLGIWVKASRAKAVAAADGPKP
ncbi:hypothetical protein RD110_07910 [Rhodoferax koreense]|uniref:Uncharacterized protein n=1 Tax=Rhodoferax koreensis TaxID=1842727 RepID=A0A1P8JTS0_9BURK|nr:hypothetical protein [Rhodoferax koreense]APW37128.1 hypothetical protein RD110_07910 [Rhodoferax koreense]